MLKSSTYKTLLNQQPYSNPNSNTILQYKKHSHLSLEHLKLNYTRIIYIKKKKHIDFKSCKFRNSYIIISKVKLTKACLKMRSRTMVLWLVKQTFHKVFHSLIQSCFNMLLIVMECSWMIFESIIIHWPHVFSVKFQRWDRIFRLRSRIKFKL